MLNLIILSITLTYASAVLIPIGSPVLPKYTHPILTYSAPPAPIPIISSQYRAQDTFGQYAYGFSAGNGISKTEARGIDGSVAGGYSYIDPDGKQVSLSYTSGDKGFEVISDAVPKPVEVTPEVAEATKKHLEARAEAAALAAASPEEEVKEEVLPAQVLSARPILAGAVPYVLAKSLPAVTYAAPAPLVKYVVAHPPIVKHSVYGYSFVA